MQTVICQFEPGAADQIALARFKLPPGSNRGHPVQTGSHGLNRVGPVQTGWQFNMGDPVQTAESESKLDGPDQNWEVVANRGHASQTALPGSNWVFPVQRGFAARPK